MATISAVPANKDPILYKELGEKIKSYQSIIIFRKDNPDADAYGAQLGLKEVLHENFPNKDIYAAGDNADFLNPIGRMDTIPEDVAKKSLGIVLDAASPEWIDDYDLYKQCKEVVKVDDHPEMSDYGTIQIEDESMSTISELVTEICLDNNWKIDNEAARCFLLGILDGTSYLRTDIINKHAFIILGKLIEIDPDMKDIFGSMEMITDGEIKLKKYIVNHFKHTFGNTTWLYIPKKKLDEWDVDPNRAATFIWLLMDMSQGEFTLMFTEYSKDKIRVQFRSKTRPVNFFAAKYGGWGTTNSAGAFLKDKKQIKSILKTLDEETI